MKRRIAFGMILTAVFLSPIIAIIWGGLSDEIGPAAVALVLGNKVSPDGLPSSRLKGRLDKATELYKNGFFPLIIVSGGTGKEGFPEGTAMKTYLISQGIPESSIIVDNDGLNTHASARYTAQFLQKHQLKSVFIITQFYHIPRSKLALSNFGITKIYNAHASYFEVPDILSTLRELPAYVKYFLRKKEAQQGS